jgi:uncharacterized membrane protein
MSKNLWTLIRTLTFILIGLMNTVFIRPEDIGSWKNYVGYLFLIGAAIDAFFLVRKYVKKNGRQPGATAKTKPD